MLVAVAWAQLPGGAGSSGSTWLSLVPFVLIFVLFYFLLILPQQKRQKQQRAMLEALKKGDKVISSGGIWGTITNLNKDTVTMQVADNTKIKMSREHITRLRTEDEDDSKS